MKSDFESTWDEEVHWLEPYKWDFDIPLRGWQVRLLNFFRENPQSRRFAVVKARSVGLSWFMMYYFLTQPNPSKVFYLLNHERSINHIGHYLNDITRSLKKAGFTPRVDMVIEAIQRIKKGSSLYQEISRANQIYIDDADSITSRDWDAPLTLNAYQIYTYGSSVCGADHTIFKRAMEHPATKKFKVSWLDALDSFPKDWIEKQKENMPEEIWKQIMELGPYGSTPI